MKADQFVKEANELFCETVTVYFSDGGISIGSITYLERPSEKVAKIKLERVNTDRTEIIENKKVEKIERV